MDNDSQFQKDLLAGLDCMSDGDAATNVAVHKKVVALADAPPASSLLLK
jgi:hypothetical protein